MPLRRVISALLLAGFLGAVPAAQGQSTTLSAPPTLSPVPTQLPPTTTAKRTTPPKRTTKRRPSTPKQTANGPASLPKTGADTGALGLFGLALVLGGAGLRLRAGGPRRRARA